MDASFPTFIDWLRKNNDWLREEWSESGDDVVYGESEFRTWAKMKYDNEKMKHQLLTQR